MSGEAMPSAETAAIDGTRDLPLDLMVNLAAVGVGERCGRTPGCTLAPHLDRDPCEVPAPAKINEGMFTSARLDWATPQAFFDIVHDEFGFTLDAAAEPHNAKCETYYDEAQDGLGQPWTGVVWCNPPYGRAIGKWVEKGYREAQKGATVVMLIPARTDTSYWHDYVMRASEIRLIRGRLVFGQGEGISNAPFPSALVVFRAGEHTPVVSTAERGELTRRAS